MRREARAALLFLTPTAVLLTLFFFAPVIFLIYAGGRAVWGSPMRWFLYAALISAMAPLANPYGWRLYVHVFRYLTDSELLSRIGEFQSIVCKHQTRRQELHQIGKLAVILRHQRIGRRYRTVRDARIERAKRQQRVIDRIAGENDDRPFGGETARQQA